MSTAPESRSDSSSSSNRSFTLPAHVTVSLRAGFVLAIANIICVAILVWAYLHAKGAENLISVTGSAKQTIVSDLIVWQTKISANHTDLVAGYAALKSATEKTVAWLKSQGVPETQIKLSAVWTKKNYVRDEKGNPTDKVSSFDLIEKVEIASTDVVKVSEVARKVTDLIEQGVMLESQPPAYHYTKLADLKIVMLAEATKDATTRAQQIASNSGATLGSIRDARMGVMQINAIHSTDVSDYGNNDTTSLEKEITAVVSAKFELK